MKNLKINNDNDPLFHNYINNFIAKTKILFELYLRYKREFPRGTGYGRGDEIPTPIVCACEHGRMDDVELFMNLHPFHKYITNRDVNSYRDDMTLKDMVNQVGTGSGGFECTPLMIAAKEEHFQIVKYLIEQGEADPNIVICDDVNALHYAVCNTRTNTELMKLLLINMNLDSINKQDSLGATPLDDAYYNNDSPIRQEIIALLRSKGGKANWHDENGRRVGYGNGDLYPHNKDRRLVVAGTDLEVVRVALTKIDEINKLYDEFTLLDAVYEYNYSPICQEIIALLRSKGGKANCHDENGRIVEEGNGDLNH